jgi:hypothetical protein
MEVAAAKSANIWAQPGTLGFLVVFGMAIVLFFVFRSLIKQLRKVNEAARIEAEQAESATVDGGKSRPDVLANGSVAARPSSNGRAPG